MNLDFRSEKALEGARAYAAGQDNGHQCSECRFAQLYALQDRAECVADGNRHFGQVRLATSPACGRFALRPSSDVAITTFVPVATVRERTLAHAS